MPTKKKKFIDKKKAVTFHLVHRSQQDPLAADEGAPQHVLIQEGTKKRLDEQRKFGVYFDDEYNYLQHLKDVDNVPEWEPIVNRTRLHVDVNVPLSNSEKTFPTLEPVKSQLQLPSSVFQSTVEEPVGLLNKAAPNTGPHPEWDPDIVAALDDDFNFDDSENELDDDFILMANAGNEAAHSDDDYSGDSDEDMDDEFETRSRFTNYSMSSSILPRSDIMQTLDDRFEKLYEEYDDMEVGDLDGEELGGFVDPDSEVMTQLLQDYQQNKEQNKLSNMEAPKDRMIRFKEFGMEEDLVEVEPEHRAREDRWDCESILSTYSNLYNRPKLISEKSDRISINPKTGLPNDVLRTGLTEKQLKKLDESNGMTSTAPQSVSSRISSMSCIRLKDETPEQRKERKKVVKEFRKERRVEKKANKEAFKEEAKRQQKVLSNLKQNLQGIKII